MISNLEISKLLEYYKNGITLIGLCDSQLVNVVFPYVRGSFGLLADTFRQKVIEIKSLNAGSSFYNKLEHAQAIVEEDLTVEEINLLSSYSYLMASSKNE